MGTVYGAIIQTAFSAIQIVFLFFLQENNLQNSLIPFIRVTMCVRDVVKK
jgi:hypothetical protein